MTEIRKEGREEKEERRRQNRIQQITSCGLLKIGGKRVRKKEIRKLKERNKKEVKNIQKKGNYWKVSALIPRDWRQIKNLLSLMRIVN